MKYEVWPADGNRDEAVTVDCHAPLFAAELAAEKLHNQHDGWEWEWPVTLRVAVAGAEWAQDFEVEREMAQVFSASPVKARA